MVLVPKNTNVYVEVSEWENQKLNSLYDYSIKQAEYDYVSGYDTDPHMK